MCKVYIEKRKSKNEKSYICLYVDLGYKQMILSFNDGDIAQLLGVSVKSLYETEFDSPVEVAQLESFVGE